MPTAPEAVFSYEVKTSEDPDIGPVTTIICHGRLVSEILKSDQGSVKPLIPKGGHIDLDLTNLAHMDSSGLGTLVGLKVSALKEGYCRLRLVNLSPRVAELLRLTNLTNLFAS